MKRIILSAVPAIGLSAACGGAAAEKIEWSRPDNSQPVQVRPDAGGQQAAIWPPPPVPERPPPQPDFGGGVIILGMR